jgi:hypothetical protein
VEHSRAGGSPGALERENLAGLVERVTFHNDESGFCVLRVKVRGRGDLIPLLAMRQPLAPTRRSRWTERLASPGIARESDNNRALVCAIFQVS